MNKSNVRSELFGKPGSLLFGLPQPKPAAIAGSIAAGTTTAPATKSIDASSSLGYFVFPPASFSAYSASGFGVNYASSTSSEPRTTPEHPWTPRDDRGTNPDVQAQLDADYEAHRQHLAELRKQRLAREAEEARKGEEYWVSCGGVLRDEFGRRDMERTKAIREELKLREIEKRLTEMWEDHETRWKKLVLRTGPGGKSNPPSPHLSANSVSTQSKTLTIVDITPIHYLSFDDIPWPVQLEENDARLNVTLQDLTRERIEEFLLKPLTVRGCTISRKERIRSSLLRWHPDKLSAIIKQTDPQQKEDVMEGIHAVIRCLHGLNTGS
ncbi:hypothetical protein MD484_g7451, partial [Candolleomyces efflorescens]